MKDIFMPIGSNECNIFVVNPTFNQTIITFLLPSKAFLFMETRILTLFDDDFFPPDPPKEKPKKEKASKPQTISDSEDADLDQKETDIIAEALNEFHQKELKENGSPEAQNKVTEIEQEPAIEQQDTITESIVTVPEGVETKEQVTDSETENSNNTIVDTGSDADFQTSEIAPDEARKNIEENVEEEDVTEQDEIIQSMEEEADSVTEPDHNNEITTATNEDKELSKQILSELIQLDYTALMQKEYSFDLNHATVINKELPKPKSQPDKVVAVNHIEEPEDEEEVFEDVTPLPEWKLDKNYYTIGEVANLFEVNTSHIRFWTNEFKLRPRTTRKGDRLYSPKDIAELRLIHHLVKVKKHTIKGAREKLKAEKSDVNNKLDLKESLVQLKETLLKIREQL